MLRYRCVGGHRKIKSRVFVKSQTYYHPYVATDVSDSPCVILPPIRACAFQRRVWHLSDSRTLSSFRVAHSSDNDFTQRPPTHPRAANATRSRAAEPAPLRRGDDGRPTTPRHGVRGARWAADRPRHEPH